MKKMKCRSCNAPVYACPDPACEEFFHHEWWINPDEADTGCSLSDITRDEVMRVGSKVDQSNEDMLQLLKDIVQTCEAKDISLVHQWKTSLGEMAPPESIASDLLIRAYQLIGVAEKEK